jgi:heme-degrading monooxygenase HmoA
MIARLWHGVTRAADYDAYLDFLRARAIPDYRSIDGNRGVYILRRLEANQAHFLIITYWDSYEAIARFAGADMARAKYYPEDQEYLLEFEPTVTHYEVAAALEA